MMYEDPKFRCVSIVDMNAAASEANIIPFNPAGRYFISMMMYACSTL